MRWKLFIFFLFFWASPGSVLKMANTFVIATLLKRCSMYLTREYCQSDKCSKVYDSLASMVLSTFFPSFHVSRCSCRWCCFFCWFFVTLVRCYFNSSIEYAPCLWWHLAHRMLSIRMYIKLNWKACFILMPLLAIVCRRRNKNDNPIPFQFVLCIYTQDVTLSVSCSLTRSFCLLSVC